MSPRLGLWPCSFQTTRKWQRVNSWVQRDPNSWRETFHLVSWCWTEVSRLISSQWVFLNPRGCGWASVLCLMVHRGWGACHWPSVWQGSARWEAPCRPSWLGLVQWWICWLYSWWCQCHFLQLWFLYGAWAGCPWTQWRRTWCSERRQPWAWIEQYHSQSMWYSDWRQSKYCLEFFMVTYHPE